MLRYPTVGEIVAASFEPNKISYGFVESHSTNLKNYIFVYWFDIGESFSTEIRRLQQVL
jgi:hypothetical protein